MNQFICITGADRGLGLELVKIYLEKGCTVFAGRYMPGEAQLGALKEYHGDRLHIVDLDISDGSSVKNAAEYIASVTGCLDVLINNAAILGDTDATILDSIDFDEVRRVFDVNSLGPLRVTNALMPLLVGGGTRLVVNISSEAGSVGQSYRKGWFGYCMSKAALNMQSSIIHNSLKEMGGQVLLIHPGWMQTYMKGSRDEAATFTPAQSAEKICSIVQNHEKYKGDSPAFVDYNGSPMEW